MEEIKRLDQECWICETCGIQFAPSAVPPTVCHICTDERQFVPKGGQKWTTQEQMKQRGYRNMYQKHEPNLFSIATAPRFGIGQRAFLLQTPDGNLLWDCVSFLDDATIEIIKGLGGLRAIAISHPHFYAANAQWSTAFGNIPVYLNEKDKKWIGYDHANIIYWSGENLPLWSGMKIVHLGGHFAGAAVLHWPSGADGRGVIISGDILQVSMDRKTVSVMRSFPNYIPLSPSHVRRILDNVDKLNYERLYGAFFELEINECAKECVRKSLQRHLSWLTNEALED